MDKVIQATKANRQFSHLLRKVQEGQSDVVTCMGRPIAQIVWCMRKNEAGFQARERLLERQRSQPAIDIGPWTGGKLYER